MPYLFPEHPRELSSLPRPFVTRDQHPQECLPASSLRFWMLSLFHNSQAVLTKAPPTVAIDQLSAAKPGGNSLLLIVLPSDQVPVLFGREYRKKP